MRKSKQHPSRTLKGERMLAMFESLSRGEAIEKAKAAEQFKVDEKTVGRDIEDIRNYIQDNHPTTNLSYERKRKGYVWDKKQADWLNKQEVLAIAKVLLESIVNNIR